VEDNPGDALLLQTTLREKQDPPYQMEIAADLHSGLERMAKGGLDLVLLDLFLPDSSGFPTLQSILKAEPHLPVVVLTGFSDRTTAMRSLQEGAQDFLSKDGLDVTLLDRSIRYAIERFSLLSKMRESQERYFLMAHGSRDGLWDWDLRTDEVFFSSRWKMMLGYADHEVGRTPSEWFDRVHPQDLPSVRGELQRHFAGQSSHFSIEHRLRHKDGRYRWVLGRGQAIFARPGFPARVAGSFTDITRHKNMEQQLALRAYYDPLTGLPNRAFFMDGLARAFARVQRQTLGLFALFYLDLDSLKTVNDKMGHQAGDNLLVAFAQRLKSCVRPHDLIARLGGDEFTVLLEDLASRSEALEVAERIVEAMRRPFASGKGEAISTVSLGVAYSDGPEATVDGILKAADRAMYQAKQAGKSRYEIDGGPFPTGLEGRGHGK